MTVKRNRADGGRSPASRAPVDQGVAHDINAYLTDVQPVVAAIPGEQLARLTAELMQAGAEGRTVFILGNGGSAATASHLACDLAKTAAVAGAPALRAVALTDNVPLITAIGNDLSYDRIFADQLRVFARPGDLTIIISASGNSPNALLAAEVARELGLLVVGFTGFGGGKLLALCDLCLVVSSDEYGPVEDAHMIMAHALTAALRAATRRAHAANAPALPEAIRATADAAPAAASARKGPLTSPAYGRLSKEAAETAETTEQSQPLTIFLDRDGVINRNSDDYVKSWSEFEFLPGSLEALARLRRAGHQVFIVSNQACIAKGLTTREDVDDLHQRMLAEIERSGGAINGILYCPHRPQDTCGCRKPKPGLIAQACERFDLDLSRAILIGDGATDLGLARAVGIPAILVLSGLGWRTAAALSPQELRACRVALSLNHAVRMLLDEETEDESILRMLVRNARQSAEIAELAEIEVAAAAANGVVGARFATGESAEPERALLARRRRV